MQKEKDGGTVMLPRGAHFDPAAIFAESASSVFSSASSSTDSSADGLHDDYLRLKGLYGNAIPPLWGGTDGVPQTATAAASLQQFQAQSRQERRYFRHRGALEYQGSAVFYGDAVPGDAADAAAGTGAAERLASHRRRDSTFYTSEEENKRVLFQLQPWLQSGVSEESDEPAVAAPTQTFQPPLRTGGAGTTAVNILNSRGAPRAPRAASTQPSAATPFPLSVEDILPPEKDLVATTTPTEPEVEKSSPDTQDATITAVSAEQPAPADDSIVNGMPPLRAHRYVERANGVYVDHHQYAELVARREAKDQLWMAEEEADMRRTRRWDRKLRGKGGGGGARGSITGGAGGGANGNGAAASKEIHVKYHWSRDAVNYRRQMLMLMHCILRLHSFLIALAAGVALVTVVGATLPLPWEPSSSLNGNVTFFVSIARISGLNDSELSASPSSGPGLVLEDWAPVLKPGSMSPALLVTLLAPFSVPLLLCLCLLILVTGCAPLPWGAAESYWMSQYRVWLAAAAATSQTGPADGEHRPFSTAHHGAHSSFDAPGSSFYGTISTTNALSGTALPQRRHPAEELLSASAAATDFFGTMTMPQANDDGVGGILGRSLSFGMGGAGLGAPTSQPLSPRSRYYDMATAMNTMTAGGIHSSAIGHLDSGSGGRRSSLSASGTFSTLPTLWRSGTANGAAAAATQASPAAGVRLPSLVKTSDTDAATTGLLRAGLPLCPTAPLEGQLSADHRVALAVDRLQRHTATSLWNGWRYLRSGRLFGCKGPSAAVNPVDAVSGEEPRLPSLYLQVLLQLRLWATACCLGLTIVELALVDEQGLSFLWEMSSRNYQVPLLMAIYCTRAALFFTAFLSTLLC